MGCRLSNDVNFCQKLSRLNLNVINDQVPQRFQDQNGNTTFRMQPPRYLIFFCLENEKKVRLDIQI